MFTLIFQLVAFIIFLAPFIFAFMVVLSEGSDRRTEAQKELDRVSQKASFERLKAKHLADLKDCQRHRDFMNSCK